MRNDTNAPGTGSTDEYDRHVAEAGGDYKVKTKKYQNLIAKVLCVLAAIVLWFYVVGTNTAIEERDFNSIPVTVENLDTIGAGMSVISGDDYTVDLTLSGAKAELDKLSAEDIKAYVDVGGITESGEHTLEVHIALPKGISVVRQSSNMVRTYIDESISVPVPVVVKPLYTIENDFELGIPEPDVETVNVTGPKAQLENVSHALVTVDLGRINKSVTATATPVLYDKSGAEITGTYIKMQTREISVRIPVYTYKEVPLKADYVHGYYTSSNVKIAFSPERIKLKGDPDVLAAIGSVPITIDETQITEDCTLELEIPELDGTDNVSGTTRAKVTIEHRNTTTANMTVTVSVANNNNISHMLESSTIDVTFRGTKTQLDLLPKSADDIRAVVDLDAIPADLADTSQPVSVPVTVTVDGALAGRVYAVGTYEMKVMIRN